MTCGPKSLLQKSENLFPQLSVTEDVQQCALPTVTQIRDGVGLAYSEISGPGICGPNRLKTFRKESR